MMRLTFFTGRMDGQMICTYMHRQMCVCVSACVHVSVLGRRNACMTVFMHVCMHACMHACANIMSCHVMSRHVEGVRACMYVYMYVSANVCTYLGTHACLQVCRKACL